MWWYGMVMWQCPCDFLYINVCSHRPAVQLVKCFFLNFCSLSQLLLEGDDCVYFESFCYDRSVTSKFSWDVLKKHTHKHTHKLAL